MSQNANAAASAYTYQLSIKNLFLAPIAYRPEQEIVYKGSFRYTYQAWRERVAKLATVLRQAGIHPGDTVAVMDYDSHRFLECYFAIPMIGAVLHTINIRLSSEQLLYTIEHAEDKIIIVNSELCPLLEAIRSRLSSLGKVILIREGKDCAASSLNFYGEYDELLEAAEALTEFPEIDENERATTFYTTGTTGLPKGVFFSHRQIVLHTLSCALTLASNPEQGNFHREDVYMPLTPMFHVHAWGIPYIATFLGVKQVYPGKYVSGSLLELISSEKVTFSHCVPTVLALLLRDPSSARYDLSKLKCVVGGQSLPQALCAEAVARGIDVFSGYGMSETCPVITITSLDSAELGLPPEKQVALRCRTGRALGLAQLRIRNGQGAAIERNDLASGEIQVRSPWLTLGYFKDSANSERLWEGGWLHTQDVATQNESGSYRITDRLKDVIKVGGEWLSSLEIEDVIARHPAVAEVGVVGKVDPKWGEVPVAAVVLREEKAVSEHRLVEHVKGFVGKGLLPREAILLQIKFVPALPKTSVGKTNKLALRESLGNQAN
jgi:fatty-acyl-CoA synthase